VEVSLLTQYLAPARPRSAPTGALHIEELEAARQLAKHLRLVQ
jgi:hypothetical protein